jgi:SWI/SNF-related matrix-associated actin-dependent regulator 1 of chromatin subfamily A
MVFVQIDVILTTYGLIEGGSEDRNFINSLNLNFVVYDEGHRLKNCRAKRYHSLIRIKVIVLYL